MNMTKKSFWGKYKKLICGIILLLLSGALFSEDYFVRDLNELDEFMLMGEIDLRTETGFDKPVLYKTLNHENGTKLLVLEIGKHELLNKKDGVWFKVRTTAPMWVDNGEWIKKFSDYWIFLPADTKIYDFVKG